MTPLNHSFQRNGDQAVRRLLKLTSISQSLAVVVEIFTKDEVIANDFSRQPDQWVDNLGCIFEFLFIFNRLAINETGDFSRHSLKGKREARK